MPARRALAPALAGTFVLYFAAGRLGLLAPYTSGNVSPVWPAAGAALAAMAVLGLRVWPAVLAAAFLVNYLSPIPPAAALALGAGNTLSAVFGAYLLRRLTGPRAALSRLRDVLPFVVVAVASPPIAATVGTTALYLHRVGAWADYGTAWRIWWLGDAMGVLLAAPLLLSLGDLRRQAQETRRGAELAALAAGTLLASLAVFSAGGAGRTGYGVPALTVFPFIIWGALRFRVAGASLANALIAAQAVWATALDRGPFTRFDPLSDAMMLQFFLAVVSITGLIVAAVIAERSKASEALRELSLRLLQLQDDERRRLARELHDGTAQTLAALKMNLAAAHKLAEKTGGELEKRLSQGMGATDDLVRDLRTLSYLLHPPLLDEAGLASALRWYVDGLMERGGLSVELDLPARLSRLPRDAETAVFRIVQECLANVVRHSGSPTAVVRIREDAGALRLTVTDHGKGIPDAVREGAAGVGIRGMRERVKDLGGTLSIRRAARGTVVEAALPLRRL
jgi:signal transduction histidine kinase